MNWPQIKIGDLLSDAEVFVDGDWVESKDQDPSGNVRLIQLADVGDGLFIDKSARFLTQEKARELKCTFLKPGDLLFARMPDPIGRTCIFPGSQQPCVTVVDVCIIRPNLAQTCPRFLMHCLNSPKIRREILRKATGTTRQRISRGNLKTIDVPFPPLEEQRRIAAILDKAEELRTKRQATLDLLNQLPQSIFLEMFGDPVSNPMGWSFCTFENLLENIDSGWSPKCLDRPKTGDEWGVLKLGAVTWGEFRPYENKALPSGVQPRPQLEVQRGDLLFTRKNTYDLVAAVAVVREPQAKLMMSDLIFRLKLRPQYFRSTEYLHQLLMNPIKRKEIQKLAGGSSGSMPNISKAKLSQTQIPLPPMESQYQFADRVEAIHRTKATHQTALTELDTLFASLQSNLFCRSKK